MFLAACTAIGCGGSDPCTEYDPPKKGCISFSFGNPFEVDSPYGGWCTVCANGESEVEYID